jgi:3-deoxy-D-manno-octulosonate 8-phosphate phosphatase (KDO 8-P phosphatase)
MDVDGVLTDGRIILGDSGEAKAFFARDGLGISVARHTGLRFALVTGRSGTPVERRALELRFEHVVTRCRDKAAALRELAAAESLTLDQVAFIGDDWNDLPAIRIAGISAAPADAPRQIREQVDFVSDAPGGRGAVREFLEWLVDVQGGWDAAAERWLAAEGTGQ